MSWVHPPPWFTVDKQSIHSRESQSCVIHFDALNSKLDSLMGSCALPLLMRWRKPQNLWLSALEIAYPRFWLEDKHLYVSEESKQALLELPLAGCKPWLRTNEPICFFQGPVTGADRGHVSIERKETLTVQLQLHYLELVQLGQISSTSERKHRGKPTVVNVARDWNIHSWRQVQDGQLESQGGCQERWASSNDESKSHGNVLDLVIWISSNLSWLVASIHLQVLQNPMGSVPGNPDVNQGSIHQSSIFHHHFQDATVHGTVPPARSSRHRRRGDAGGAKATSWGCSTFRWLINLLAHLRLDEDGTFPIEHGDFSKCHANFQGVYLILVHLIGFL